MNLTHNGVEISINVHNPNDWAAIQVGCDVIHALLSVPALSAASHPNSAPSPEGAGVAAAASGQIGLQIDCIRCRKAIAQQGALLFSPPVYGTVQKHHVCVECWPSIFGASERRFLIAPPPIGSDWREQGGVYAGIGRAEDGTQHHLIVGPEYDGVLDYAAAEKWVKIGPEAEWGQDANWSLGTRRMHLLAAATVPELFKEAAYWTSEVHPHSDEDAFGYVYVNGASGNWYKKSKLRARAFRTVAVA